MDDDGKQVSVNYGNVNDGAEERILKNSRSFFRIPALKEQR